MLRPAGSRHDQWNAVQISLFEPEIFQIPYPIAKETGHNIDRFRPLHGQRRHVRFNNLNVKTALRGYRHRPHFDVAVRNRQPEFIVGKFQQYGVVDKSPVMIAKRHVLTLTCFGLADIAGRHILREHGGVRTDELNLTLRSHVPHGHTIYQSIIFFFRITKMNRYEHVIVNGE